MAIVYPLTPPVNKGISSITLKALAVTAISKSPFTLKQQVQAFPGQQWQAIVTLPPMTRVNAEEWNAFLISLNGREGTFYLGDPAGANPQGVWSGSPQVNGANQSGNELIIDGGGAGVTNYAKAGDWFHLVIGSGTQRLHKVLKAANTNGSGQTTLTIWPNLREAPADNTPLVFTNAKGIFRLSQSSMDITIDVGSIFSQSFTCEEVL